MGLSGNGPKWEWPKWERPKWEWPKRDQVRVNFDALAQRLSEPALNALVPLLLSAANSAGPKKEFAYVGTA